MSHSLSILSKSKIFIIIFILATLVYGCKKDPGFYTQGFQTGTSAQLVGLQVVTNEEIWACGSSSTIICTFDGGERWAQYKYEERDSLQFRDIHVKKSGEVLVLSIGEGKLSGIYSFDRESESWVPRYQMPYEDGFLDGFAFWGDSVGIAYGDSRNGVLFLLRSTNGGKNWIELDSATLPVGLENEGGFASSGGLVNTLSGGEGWIGTGASESARLLTTLDYGKTWVATPTPMISGATAGITTVKFASPKKGILVGGDLGIKEAYTQNLFITDAGGKVWYPMSRPITTGAFYGADIIDSNNDSRIIICGPAGADLSKDNGTNWAQFSNENLWSASWADYNTAWLVGAKGVVVKLVLE